MSVRAVKHGLRVEEVYDGSPAKEGGLKAGDIIVGANGKSLAGKTSDESTALIKGPAGHDGPPEARATGASCAEAREGRHPDRAVRDRARRRQEDRLGPARRLHVRLGRRRQAAVEKELKAGAKGVVLDLRHNGGGLLNEAVKVVVGVPRRRARRVHEGPRAAGARLQRRGRGDRARSRWSCWSTRARPGLGDRRRRAAGPQAREGRRHAHVRQGRLPGDRAAAQRRRAGHHRRRVLHAVGPQPGRGGVRKGAGITPDIQASDDPEDRAGRGAREGAARRWPRSERRAARRRPREARRTTRSRRSSSAGTASTSTSRAAASASATSCSSSPGRGGRARVERRIGRPDVARDVLEALMLQRGLRRRFDPLVEREARERRRRRPSPAARDFRDAADLHDRSADRARLRRRDLGRGARRRRGARVGAHRGRRRRSCGPAPRSTARRSGARTRSTSPGLVEPMLPEALSNRRLLARAGRGPAGRDGRARVRGREGAPHGVPPLGDPQRRAARLPARGPHLRGRERRRSRGRSRSPPRGRWPPRWPSARGAGRAGRRVAEPEFGFSRDGHVESAAAVRADRVARADRVPDDRRQRGGRGAAGVAQAARAVPRARAARPARAWSGCSTSSRRSTCRRRRRRST